MMNEGMFGFIYQLYRHNKLFVKDTLKKLWIRLGDFIFWLSEKDGYSHNKPPITKPDSTLHDWDEYDKLIEFDRKKVFAAVDASNVRISNMSKKERHNLRDEVGKFRKKTEQDNQQQLPITRYGVPTVERFKDN